MKTPASIAGHPIHPMLVAMAINLTVVAFYAVNFWLRLQDAQNSSAVWLSVIGIDFGVDRF